MHDMGLSMPALLNKEDSILAQFFINVKDLNEREEKVVAAVTHCRERGYVVPIINHPNPDIVFSLPDTSHLGYEIKNEAIAKSFLTIHEAHLSGQNK